MLPDTPVAAICLEPSSVTAEGEFFSFSRRRCARTMMFSGALLLTSGGMALLTLPLRGCI